MRGVTVGPVHSHGTGRLSRPLTQSRIHSEELIVHHGCSGDDSNGLACSRERVEWSGSLPKILCHDIGKLLETVILLLDLLFALDDRSDIAKDDQPFAVSAC